MRRGCVLSAGGLVGLLIVLVLVGLTSSVFTKSVCGCATVNHYVVSNLNSLDTLVQQYAGTHDGYCPTYAELVALIPVHDREYLLPHLTDKVDPGTRTFTFTPTTADVSKIGYTISPDGRSYVLVGIGLTEKYRTIYLFGHRVCKVPIGRELPILHPGDVPPEPSPIS